MAVRPPNMHDGGVVERRLRPVYDWLDFGNNKKALQEVEKVLKKSPTLQAARALKALSLFRLGKSAEAHAVLEALAAEKPHDDTTLQAMTISYRECQQLSKICSIYEEAIKKDPKSEELHSHLFMAYMRVGDFKAQQLAAMSLYKLAPKNPYYFWAVMSIVLQAKESEDKTKKTILLTLAQRMVDNFINDKKMEAEQEARLYIMILELQEKWEEIIKFLESPLYASLVPGTIAQTSMPYLIKLGEWKRLNIICKELLYDNQDRWDYYMTYFDSVFHLMQEAPVEGESVDDTPEKCHEFICQLVESMSNGRTLRGPYLARLELWKRLGKDGDNTSLLGSGVALCVEYLRVFAHKPCALPDLRPYLELLPQAEREAHCREFLTCLGFDEDSQPDNMDDIQRHISCLSTYRVCSPSASADQDLVSADKLQRQYINCLQKGLHTSTVTEFCATDGYAVLAAHHYFYAAMKQESAQPLLEAVCLLQLVLHKSPGNFHAKLLMVVFYHLLGNAPAAHSIYRRLDVKHIQLISLGWLHAPQLFTEAAVSIANTVINETCATHKHHANDSVEHLTYAYKYGTFEKLVELYSWSGRLKSCGFSAGAGRDRSLLSWVVAGASHVVTPPPIPDEHFMYYTFADNRDLNIINNFDPPELRDPELKAKTYQLELSYLRLKDGIVSAVTLCTELSDQRSIEDKKSQYEELKLCADAFSTAMEKCREIYREKIKLTISFPFQPRIIAFVNSPVPYRELYSSIFILIAELSINNIASFHATCDSTAELLKSSVEAVRCEYGKEGKWPKERLEGLSNYLEFVCIASYLLGVCSDLVTPRTTKKSKKKTNQSPDEMRTTELLNKLIHTLQDSITFLEKEYDNIPNHKFQSTLEHEMKKLKLNDKYSCVVEEKLKKGHEEVIEDVKSILKKKLKHLTSIVQ